MKPGRGFLAIIVLALLLAGGWYAVRHIPLIGEVSQRLLNDEATPSLPVFTFNDLEGNSRSSTEWKSKVLVVNFWATWCPPCREEMPLFNEMQEKYGSRGVQFVGIAIDDPEMVRDFSAVYAINFPILTGGVDAIKLANSLGNRFDSLPFTAIFDREGNGRYHQAGEIKRKTLERELPPLL